MGIGLNACCHQMLAMLEGRKTPRTLPCAERGSGVLADRETKALHASFLSYSIPSILFFPTLSYSDILDEPVFFLSCFGECNGVFLGTDRGVYMVVATKYVPWLASRRNLIKQLLVLSPKEVWGSVTQHAVENQR